MVQNADHMRKIIGLILGVALLLPSGFAFAQQGQISKKMEKYFAKRGEVYFSFPLQSREKLNKLSAMVSIDELTNDQVFAYANKKEFGQFVETGIEYKVLPHSADLNLDLKMLSSELALESRAWDYYPTYDAYIDLMLAFQTNHPDLCRIDTMTTLASDRMLLTAVISDNVNSDEDEPEFFYTAQMHGDEIITYVMFLRLIDHLLENYGIDPRITNLVDNIEIYINPLANPDGAFMGGNNNINGAIRYNANYVDLNRNFPDIQDGDHPDGNEWQPETVAFMDYATAHDFVMSANTHGGAELVNYPWDTWPQRHADDAWWIFVCNEYADTAHAYSPSGYFTDQGGGVTNGYDWYTTNGCRQDYMNGFQNCREFTLELSSNKMPPASQLESFWEYNYRSFLNYLEQSLYGIRGIVTNSVSNQAVEAKIEILDHDDEYSLVYSSMPKGNYHRPIEAGTFSVQVSAEGYDTQTIDNVTVANYESLRLDVQLIPNTLTAAFAAENTTPAVGMPVVFTNNSFGEVSSWEWTFEGAEPGSSTDENPVVSYTDEGVFDVQLIVSDGSTKDTLKMVDYITVNREYAMGDHTVTSCSGHFYDPAMEDNYANNEDYVMTFLPAEDSHYVEFDFSAFDLEESTDCELDYLSIYDGKDVNAPLIGTYCGKDSPGLVFASNIYGALTFRFHSDAQNTNAGWKAEFACYNGVGVENQEEQAVKVYPNPVHAGDLHIESESALQGVIIRSYAGAMVYRQACSGHHVKVNTSGFVKGIYFVEVNTDEARMVQKIQVN